MPTATLAALALLSASGDPAAAPTEVRRFRVEHVLTLAPPEGAKEARIWFPIPRLDPEQEITELAVEAPDGWRETRDALGNRYVHVQVAEPAGKVAVTTRFVVARQEVRSRPDPAATRPLTDAERAQFAADLRSDTHVVVDDEIRALAAEIRGDETNPVRVARKLYDWVLGNVEYWVKDPSKWKASPVGSSSYCLANRTGNCTDFHSLWAALARASGIPTRLKYGSLFKTSLDGVDRDASYHCWPEFWAPDIGWISHDVALADVFAAPIALDDANREKVVLTVAAGYEGPDPALVEYYFGSLEPRRVTWTMGRDLVLEPPQSAGPVNAVAKGYVEVDGREFTGWERKMTFRELEPR